MSDGRMEHHNRGPMVGGPFDGKEWVAMIWPPDYPDGAPKSRLEACRLFNRSFPEGAIYHWDGASWIYQGPMDTDDDPGEHRGLFKALGVETEPPL